jgi:hypothetical protein
MCAKTSYLLSRKTTTLDKRSINRENKKRSINIKSRYKMAKKKTAQLSIDGLLIENLSEEDRSLIERIIVEKLQKIDDEKKNLKLFSDTYKGKIKVLKAQVDDMVEAIKNKDFSSLDYKYGVDWRESLKNEEA